VEDGAATENLLMMNKELNSLPKWAVRFLKGICPDYLFEDIEGDLIQKFNRDVKIFGEHKAKWLLHWNVISFLDLGLFYGKEFLQDWQEHI
jgi:hypothetical protein